MKASLVEKIQRKLSANSDYDYSEDYLNDLIDEAVEIIADWTRSNKSVVLTGSYDGKIITYVIQTLNIGGIEGQSYSNANGIAKTFYASPEANLKGSIPQRLI